MGAVIERSTRSIHKMSNGFERTLALQTTFQNVPSTGIWNGAWRPFVPKHPQRAVVGIRGSDWLWHS